MNTPIVLVHGFSGWGPKELGGLLDYWNVNETEEQAVYKASVPPFSSLHERASYLRAQILGVPVTFGEKHAEEHGHAEVVDKGYEGFHKEWSKENPLIFVGHSMGSPTVRYLQYGLKENLWNDNIPPEAIKAIVSICGVNNGSAFTYPMGLTKDGKTKKFSPAKVAGFLMNVHDAFGFKRLFDLDRDEWTSRQEGEGLIKHKLRVLYDGKFMSGKDNALHSLSIHTAEELNKITEPIGDTYYISFVTTQSKKLPFVKRYRPKLLTNPLLWVPATVIGMGKIHDKWKDQPTESCRETDGMVSVFSQGAPTIGKEQPRQNVYSWDAVEKGTWNVFPKVDGLDHLDVVGFTEVGKIKSKKDFYTILFDNLRKLA